MRKIHRYFTALVLGMGLLLFVAVGTASAHASVIDSTPKANSTIAKIPATIQVTTAENMTTNPSETNLFVYGPKDALVSQGKATIDRNNPTHMSVTIKTDAGDGIYIVRWITKSALDGDPDEGAFAFTVNANTTNAVAPPTTTVAPRPPASNNSASPVLPAVIVGVIALLVGLGAGFGIGRARSVTTDVTSNTGTGQESKETTRT